MEPWTVWTPGSTVWLFTSAGTSVEAVLQVNLFQKPSFLHQLTHNMKKNCSLIYQFLHENYKLRTFCVHKLFWMSKQKQKIVYVHNMLWACSFHVGTGKSMNNLSPYCGLVDARIRASEKDLSVQLETTTILEMWDMGALLTASITVTLGILAM